MFEIGSGELRATFLGNHSSEATERHDNTARHYVNEQRAATHQHGGHCTPYEALHPLRGTTPVTRQCTRYGALHPIRRGVMPTDRVQRPQSQEQTRNLRDDRRHAQGPGSSRSRGPQHSATTSQHSTIGDPSSAFSDHQPAFNNRRSVVTNHRSAANSPSTIINRRSADTPRRAVAAIRDGNASGGQPVA